MDEKEVSPGVIFVRRPVDKERMKLIEDMFEEDDARIYYVGFSRAKRNLFINIPEINGNIIQGIERLNIEYEILEA